MLLAQAASYYTRDEFLELEPVIVTSLDKLLRTYLKVCDGVETGQPAFVPPPFPCCCVRTFLSSCAEVRRVSSAAFSAAIHAQVIVVARHLRCKVMVYQRFVNLHRRVIYLYWKTPGNIRNFRELAFRLQYHVEFIAFTRSRTFSCSGVCMVWLLWVGLVFILDMGLRELAGRWRWFDPRTTGGSPAGNRLCTLCTNCRTPKPGT